MEDVEKAIAKRGAKRRRAKIPFPGQEHSEQQSSQYSGQTNDMQPEDANKEEVPQNKTPELPEDVESESEAAEQFEQLYEQLQSSISAPLTYQFEKIYEDLAIGVTSASPQPSNPGSYLPPEIYKLHTESHSQRMGILTKYTEPHRSYSSLGSVGQEEGEDPAYDLWAISQDRAAEGWSSVASVSLASLSPYSLWPSAGERLDFIPARETVVDTGERDREEEPVYQVPRAITIAVNRQEIEDGEEVQEEEEEEEEVDTEVDTEDEEGTEWESFSSIQEGAGKLVTALGKVDIRYYAWL